MSDNYDESKTGLSIAALVLGIIGIFIPLCALLALIFGCICVHKKQGIKGFAITGIVLGIVPIAIVLTFAGVGAFVAMQIPSAQDNTKVVTPTVETTPVEKIASVMAINVVQTPGFDSPGNVVYILPHNPTTGFQWEVISSDGLKVESNFIPANTNLIGAPGKQEFKITADKRGTYTFKAAYKRSGSATPANVFEQEITLNPENKDEAMILDFCGNTDVKAGEIVKITVIGNPKTGYVWSYSPSEGLKVVKEDYVVDNPELSGAPGTYVWYVTADKPGKYSFSIQYGRPWENTFIGHAEFNIIFS